MLRTPCAPVGVFPPHTAPGLKIIPVVEGSDDGGRTWRRYQYRYMLSGAASPPCWCAPHMPRLDYRMFYEGIGSTPDNMMAGTLALHEPYALSRLGLCDRLMQVHPARSPVPRPYLPPCMPPCARLTPPALPPRAHPALVHMHVHTLPRPPSPCPPRPRAHAHAHAAPPSIPVPSITSAAAPRGGRAGRIALRAQPVCWHRPSLVRMVTIALEPTPRGPHYWAEAVWGPHRPPTAAEPALWAHYVDEPEV